MADVFILQSSLAAATKLKQNIVTCCYASCFYSQNTARTTKIKQHSSWDVGICMLAN
jgi:hypothetical protein